MSEAAEQRAREERAKQKLDVACSGGDLRITIGIDILAVAVQAGPHWPAGFEITDPEQFALDALLRLLREEEDGTTLVHKMLDRAAAEALDQGSEGVSETDANRGIDEGNPR